MVDWRGAVLASLRRVSDIGRSANQSVKKLGQLNEGKKRDFNTDAVERRSDWIISTLLLDFRTILVRKHPSWFKCPRGALSLAEELYLLPLGLKCLPISLFLISHTYRTKAQGMEYGLKPLSWVTITATLLLSLYAPWWIHAAEVPNMANFDGWRDGIIFEYSDMEEVKRQMLHLAQVVSRFEHSWPIQNPGYDFLINGIQVDDHGSHYRHLYSSNSAVGSCEASNDSLWGSLYDYNAAGTGLEAIVSFPHRLVNSQGLLMWHPSTIAEEQTLHIYYSLIPNKNPDPAYLLNNTKRCEFRIERSGYCSGTLSLQDKSGNLARSPPAPVANIHYNTQSRMLEFEVLAQYIFKEATYLIDFVDFDVKTDSIRYKAPSSCSNRYDAADQQRLTFRELWYSAPHANFADALSGQYSAYNSPPCWNLTNASCSQIRYFASFSLDQILRCTDHNGNPAITYDYTPDGLLNYRGNLFVNVLAPIDVNTESW